MPPIRVASWPAVAASLPPIRVASWPAVAASLPHGFLLFGGKNGGKS